MPKAPKKQCSSPGCHNISRPGKAKCVKCEKERERERGSSCQRLYGYKWQLASKAYLKQHPLCVRCDEIGPPYRSAEEVDHIVPHDGDPELFWDLKNWQGLCKICHSTKTATEDGGFGRTVLSK